MAAAKKITLSPSRDIRAIEGQASGRDSGLAIAARQGHAEDLEAGIVIIPTGLRPAKRVQSVEVLLVTMTIRPGPRVTGESGSR